MATTQRRTTWFGLLGVLLACAVLSAGCGTEPAAQGTPGVMVESDAMLDGHRHLGAPVHESNLTVWPVYTNKPLDIGEFLTLQEAQARKLAHVRELGADGNDVAPGQQREEAQVEFPAGDDPEQDIRNALQRRGGGGAQVERVVIENKGKLPILVVAGTIIDGGNQDRQIGQDFVIAAGETVDVDAFCVEHGRWGGEQQVEIVDGVRLEVSENLQPSTVTTSPLFKAKSGLAIAPKVVRAAGQYEKDQGKVWENVRSSNAFLKTDNATDTLMGALEEADEKTQKLRAAYEHAVAARFARWAAGPNPPIGFAYAINGKPVTVRTFAHARIFQTQLPAFLKAMAVEAHMASEAEGANKRATYRAVIAMVRGIEKAREEELRETGAGNDNGYRRNGVGYNARCYLKPELVRKLKLPVGPDKVVLTEDWTAK